MFEVEVVITLIMVWVFFPNGSWRLGLGFGVAAKKKERWGKSEVSFRRLNLVGQKPPAR